jgi:hypothetical protein
MDIKAPNAIFAILTLAIKILAEHRAFQAVILSSISETDQKLVSLTQAVNAKVKEEEDLVRALVLQFAEIDITDFLNGTFEV